MQGTAHQHSRVVRALAPAAITAATVNGAVIDALGFSEALFILDTGQFGGTSPTLDVALYESDASGGTYTAVTGAAFTQITTANDDADVYLMRVRLLKRQRYLRLTRVGAGTSPTGNYSAVCVLSQASEVPVAQINAVVDVT